MAVKTATESMPASATLLASSTRKKSVFVWAWVVNRGKRQPPRSIDLATRPTDATQRTDEEAPHALERGVVLPALARKDDAGLGPEALLLHALEHSERGHARDAEFHHVQHVLVVSPALRMRGTWGVCGRRKWSDREMMIGPLPPPRRPLALGYVP